MTDAALRIAILGDGLMGRAIHALAGEQGITVSGVVDRPMMQADTQRVREVLGDADVALEFTVPTAVVDNVALCLDVGCPVVVGTTGWYDQLSSVVARVEASGGAMLWAPNFSVGVAVLTRLVERAGRLASALEGFDAHLVETHHTKKRDAPSGTAIVLERAMASGLGRPVPTTSIRQGHAPGTHEVTLDGPYERITLAHEARDRCVFAHGALVAARWLRGRSGVYTMDDVLGMEDR